MQTLRSPNKSSRLFLFVLFVLYGLLIFQYLRNRSVWNDEAFMMITISNVNAWDLFFPLDYYQAAPILFLQIEKLAFVLFGDSEYAFRIFPLLCAMAALPLFYSFCKRFTDNDLLSVAAMILLAFTPGFLFYASEAKQYGSDLFVTLLLFNAAFNNSPFVTRHRILLLSLAGVIAIFLSNVSIVILFTIGLCFLYDCWKTKRIKTEYWVPALIWIITFGSNYLLFIKDHPNTEYMRNYWMRGFLPVNIFSPEFHKFAERVVPQVFSHLLPSLPGGYLYASTALLFFAGLFFMFREKKFMLLHLCLAPIFIHLALSAMQIYPFELRMFLYHAPLYIVAITFALFRLINMFISNHQARLVTIAICIAAISFKTFIYFPVEQDDIRNPINYINAAHKPGESVYVASGAVPSIKYYIQRDLVKFNDLPITFGKERIVDKNNYLENINNLQGRLWLISSRIFPFPTNQEQEAAIINALEKRGKLIDKKQFNGSTLYLFDL